MPATEGQSGEDVSEEEENRDTTLAVESVAVAVGDSPSQLGKSSSLSPADLNAALCRLLGVGEEGVHGFLWGLAAKFRCSCAA